MPTGKRARPWEKHRRTHRASGLTSHTYLNITGPEVGAAKQTVSLEIPKETFETKVLSGIYHLVLGTVVQCVGCHALGAWMSGPLLPEHGWRSHGSHTSEARVKVPCLGQELERVPALLRCELPGLLSAGPRDQLAFAFAVYSANPYGGVQGQLQRTKKLWPPKALARCSHLTPRCPESWKTVSLVFPKATSEIVNEPQASFRVKNLKLVPYELPFGRLQLRMGEGCPGSLLGKGTMVTPWWSFRMENCW